MTGNQEKNSRGIPWSPRLVGVVCALVTGSAIIIAQGVGRADESGKPKGIPLGNFRVHPEIQVTTRWEDNIYKTATNPQSDEIVLIKPQVKMNKQGKKSKLSLAAALEAEYYNNYSLEDNYGYQFKLEYGLEPNRRLKLNAGYDYLVEHEDRGSPGTLAAPASLGPNQWLQQVWKVSTNYTKNRLQAGLNLGHGERTSGNNNQSLQNHSWNEVGASAKWAFFPKIGLLLETGWKGIQYDIQPVMDSREVRLQTGATWRVTKKTSGTVKIGMTTKQFDAKTTPTGSTLSWEGEVEWHPMTRTSVNVNLGRRFQEGATGAYVATNYRVKLDHELRPRLNVLTGISLDTNMYDTGLLERYWKTDLGLKYQFPRWFALDAGWFRSVKESTQPTANYESNGVLFTLTGTL
ncbi:MAG: outer membrane beta-barrel protein [Magnetococcus sp. YQC-5]